MKKIAFHLNCLEQGGAERVVTNLANQFATEGYEVLIATEWFGQNEFQIDEKITRVHVGLRDGDEKKSRSTQFLQRVLYLREFIKKEKPDILIAFAQRANYRALMASVGTKCPVLHSLTRYRFRCSFQERRAVYSRRREQKASFHQNFRQNPELY